MLGLFSETTLVLAKCNSAPEGEQLRLLIWFLNDPPKLITL
jgi:hypothetical protein